MLCRTPHALDEETKTAEMGRALGIESQVLDADASRSARSRHPDGRRGRRVLSAGPPPHARPLRGRDAGSARCRWASSSSGTPKSRAGASSAADHVRAVSTRDGREIEGDEFVLCGGSWSPALARELGLKLPIEAGKGYSLTLPNRGGSPAICAILSEARLAVTPMGGALRFAGTMEIAGLDEDINPVRVRAHHRGRDDLLSRDSRRRISKASRRGAGCGRARRTACPTSGAPRGYANLSIAAGHAMMGMSLGPVTGDLDRRDPRGRVAAVRHRAAFARSLRHGADAPSRSCLAHRHRPRQPILHSRPGSTSRHIFVAFWAAYLLSYLYRTINAVVSPELTRELATRARDARPAHQRVLRRVRRGSAARGRAARPLRAAPRRARAAGGRRSGRALFRVRRKHVGSCRRARVDRRRRRRLPDGSAQGDRRLGAAGTAGVVRRMGDDRRQRGRADGRHADRIRAPLRALANAVRGARARDVRRRRLDLVARSRHGEAGRGARPRGAMGGRARAVRASALLVDRAARRLLHRLVLRDPGTLVGAVAHRSQRLRSRRRGAASLRDGHRHARGLSRARVVRDAHRALRRRPATSVRRSDFALNILAFAAIVRDASGHLCLVGALRARRRHQRARVQRR